MPKTCKIFLFLFYIFSLLSCESKVEKDNTYHIENYDSLVNHVKKRLKEKEQEQLQRKIERKHQDSLNLVLDSIKKVDFDRKIMESFALSYQEKSIDIELDSLKYNVKFGNFFNPHKKYAIVKMTKSPYYTQVWQAEKDYKTWKKLIQEDYAFGGYYLKDVNFDGVTDFLFEYFSSGSGMTWGNQIYVYNQQANQFVKVETALSNPCYDKNKKIITSHYSTSYGGTGAKYIWEGFKLKEIEYFEKDFKIETNQYSTELYRLKNNKMELVKKYKSSSGKKSIPHEYRSCVEQ